MAAVQLLAPEPRVRPPRARRGLINLAAAFVVTTGGAWGLLSLAWPVAPVHVHVRWVPALAEAERVDLERRFRLAAGSLIEGTSWQYQLEDSSPANIRALVEHPRVDDTAHLNRVRFRPEFAQDRGRRILAGAVATGALGSIPLLLLVLRARRATLAVASWSALIAPLRPAPRAAADLPIDGATTALVVAACVVCALAMTWLAEASFPSALGALAVVYAGYLTGALFVPGTTASFGPAWAVIRTIAGLLLMTLGFLLSLVLSLPWYLPPALMPALALAVRGRDACAWPAAVPRWRWDGVAAGLLAVVLLAPIGITFAYMAPGAFPPVFYNVDTPPVLEKVHGLVGATSYPPGSLSNLGARRTYHYGTQGMAALISRATGLRPHHALFLVVLPLLVLGVLAAAAAAARHVAPALPRSLTVPLLLVATPSLSNTFWDTFGPQLLAAAATPGFPLATLVGDYRLWGFLSNEAKNVGALFVVLAAVASLAALPALGWPLPLFLIGCAVVVKAPLGVALLAGFLLAQAWRTMADRSLRHSTPALGAAAIFAAAVFTFFLASSSPNFRVGLFPLFHLREIVNGGRLVPFVLDLLWLLLPALVVVTARLADPERRSVPLLLMGLAPIVVVNSTRMDNVGVGGGGAGNDWLQVLHPAPILLHAFAISLASRRWGRLGRGRRAAVLVALVLAVAPVALAAARYATALVRQPHGGHEFVDNRPLAEALAAIPTAGTVIVTNDLRYPAENFTRDERQMQIPALFGHQAFAVNYAYEVVPFADERRALQRLLQGPSWDEAIAAAARAHGWTHLLIRRDYAHPAAIPLERLFANAAYEVYRFP